MKKYNDLYDNRHIYRGFHPQENGKTVIKLNGEKIRGEWVEGYYGQFHNRPKIQKENSHQIFQPSEYAYLAGSCIGGLWYIVLPETVGQWVTTDKNGKDVFEEDIVSTHFDGEYAEGVVVYKEKDLQYLIQLTEFERCPNFVGCTFQTIRTDVIELIGSKWEVQE